MDADGSHPVDAVPRHMTALKDAALGLPVRDCTAGFRAYRRAALALLSDDGRQADRYSLPIASTWQVLWRIRAGRTRTRGMQEQAA
jgi:dolichol-phosphate mannosyltransferase